MKFLFSFSALFISLIAASKTADTFIGTGLINRHNICYMNAFLSCLYDVTPLRKAIYENYQESPLNEAVAGVFARKQLQLLPAISLENNMMRTINLLLPHWAFDELQDVDEFFKQIYRLFSENIIQKLGYQVRDVVKTVKYNEFIINDGTIVNEPMITVKLPERKSSTRMNLQILLSESFNQWEHRDYTMYRDQYPKFFESNEIIWYKEAVSVAAKSRKEVLNFGDVLPVFIARRTVDTGSNKRDFRNDVVAAPDELELFTSDGTKVGFTLTAFVVYDSGHYKAYTKSFPDKSWKLYNDDIVERVDIRDIFEYVSKHAVMVFYTRKGKSCFTAIPAPIRNWSLMSMITEHMERVLVPKIDRMNL